MNKHQNYAAFNNNPYITASHQALIVHVSIKALLGLGSDVGIIIEGSIILMFVHRNCYRLKYRLTLHGLLNFFFLLLVCLLFIYNSREALG